MKKLKGILAGVVSLCMLSTMATGVLADEFEGLGDFFEDGICIGESNEKIDLAEKVKEYRKLIEFKEEMEEKLKEIKKGLEETPMYSPENDEFIDQFALVSENIQAAEEELQILKDEIRMARKGHHQYPQIGDSDGFDDDIEIGDSDDDDDDDDFEIGYSGHKKHHHHHKDFKEDRWHGCISSDFDFGGFGHFKDVDFEGIKEAVLSLIDDYSDYENYIATGDEEWLLKNKHQITVKISSEDGNYKVKFNPIQEDGKVTSCYMYIVNDDVITEGYFISTEDYMNIKQILNGAFLKDNVVAIKNDIDDFDDFTDFIENTYDNQEDYFFDVDGNGKVATNDLLQNKKYLLGLNEEIGNYDSTNDGNSTSADLLNLKKKLLGIL